MHAAATDIKNLYDRVTGFVARRVSNREDALDIVQDVFLKLSTRNEGNLRAPSAWVFRVARNAIIDYYRRLDRSPAMLEEDVPPPEESSPENEVARCLPPMMARLNKSDRELLRGIHWRGESQKGLAKDSRVSYATVKSRVQRARERLKDELRSCCRLNLDARGVPIGCEE